jgi:hypothetical protein
MCLKILYTREQHSNRGPPRVQSPAKQAEIQKQVDELLRPKVIEHSNASYYLQVILASKPNDEWRFCIDYRKLNDCTQSASWPIPNIKDGPNGRLSSSTSRAWDPHVPSVHMFLRIISILQTTFWTKESSIILSTDDVLSCPHRTHIFSM